MLTSTITNITNITKRTKRETSVILNFQIENIFDYTIE